MGCAYFLLALVAAYAESLSLIPAWSNSGRRAQPASRASERCRSKPPSKPASFRAAAFGLRKIQPAEAPAGMQIVLGKGQELFGEGDEAELFFQAMSGAIRTRLSDGRRQIEPSTCAATSSVWRRTRSFASPPRPSAT